MPVSGAKNSALKLMAATLLAPGKTTLQNVPDISDVHVMGKVLKGMGATIDVLDEHTLEIDTSQVAGPLPSRQNCHAGRLQPGCSQDRYAHSWS